MYTKRKYRDERTRIVRLESHIYSI